MTINLVSAPPGSRLLAAAQELGDQETRQVGLLPYAAWDEYAASGHVLVAVDEDEVARGYVAYRVPRDEVRIAQLVVSPTARGQGVARRLIDELRKLHGDRRGIGLRCRRDWSAHTAWPRLGFTSMGERPGRSALGSILTEWWLDFGHPDLISWAPGETDTAALIDANIFLDLHGCTGAEAKNTANVLEAFSDRLDLVVAPELYNDLDRQENPAERSRLKRQVGAYAMLNADPRMVEAWSKRIVAEAGASDRSAQDRSDTRHVAWAAAAGVPIVLTRDERATKRLGTAARGIANITICHPSTLAAVLHERESTAAYAPAALVDTQFEVQEITDKPALANQFLDTGAPERRSDFTQRVRQVCGQRPRSSLRLVRDAEGLPRALLGTCPDESGTHVTVARLRKGLLEATLATRLVDLVRRAAADAGQPVMLVSDPHCPARLQKAFRADGFIETSTGLTGLTLDAPVPQADLTDLVRKQLHGRPEAMAMLQVIQGDPPPAGVEHTLRPLRILDANLPTWLVPIRQQGASDLFGHPAMLVARDDQLGLGIEHVFYKKQKAGESAPGRVLWYVSDPRSEVFACSLLAEVRDEPAHTLFRRYRRLGVYQLADVQRCERPDGRARALNVTDTELFRRPVSLKRLRELAGVHGHRIQVQGACRISPELFSSIIKEAQDHEPFNRNSAHGLVDSSTPHRQHPVRG